ncbi:MAG TPA: transposase [Thermoanaerobaculia bacterium]|nr:transposase [Thermoanaerobaculia bacterium]
MSNDRSVYRRRLPHYQSRHKDYLVTFCTQDRWVLPDVARSIALSHIIVIHRKLMFLHTATAMPDHVHIVISPLDGPDGNAYGIAEILRRIKGTSSRSINRALDRTGPVWQHESWDHELRNDESLRQKCEYVANNPVRAGIVTRPEDYPWLWRQWLDDKAECESEPVLDVAPASAGDPEHTDAG